MEIGKHKDIQVGQEVHKGDCVAGEGERDLTEQIQEPGVWESLGRPWHQGKSGVRSTVGVLGILGGAKSQDFHRGK